MLWRTHLLFGILCGLFLSPYLDLSPYYYYSLVALGALLPDLDHSNSYISKKIKPISFILNFFLKHRGILHSFIFSIIVFIISKNIIGIYSYPLFIGYFSHILIDAFTKEGINFLYPIANLRLSGFIEVGSSGETLLSVGIIILLILSFI